jgi:hypothetical protein
MKDALPLATSLEIVVQALQGTSLTSDRAQGHARMLSAAGTALSTMMPDGFFDTEPAQLIVLMASAPEGET